MLRGWKYLHEDQIIRMFYHKVWNTEENSDLMTLMDAEHHQKMTACQETSQVEAKVLPCVETSKQISMNG